MESSSVRIRTVSYTHLDVYKRQELVSSFFIMVTNTPQYGDDGILLFADCALNQNPNPQELACIAGDSAKSYEAFIGKEPRVCLLYTSRCV